MGLCQILPDGKDKISKTLNSLIDKGYYTEVVELGPPSKMEDKEWHGASGSFGDGKGAESAGNGNVRVTLNLVGGNSKVVINKDGGMTIEWDGTFFPIRYEFLREY